MQYSFVVISEYGHYKYFLRGVGIPSLIDGHIGGPVLNSDQANDYKKRWATLASELSKARMATRFGDSFVILMWLVNKFTEILGNEIELKD